MNKWETIDSVPLGRFNADYITVRNLHTVRMALAGIDRPILSGIEAIKGEVTADDVEWLMEAEHVVQSGQGSISQHGAD